MTMYKCMNPACQDGEKLGHVFEAEVPVCDKCKADGRDKRLSAIVHKLTIIHFDPPSPIPGLGIGVPLCDAGASIQTVAKRGEQMTGEPGAVTCPKCKAHEAWASFEKIDLTQRVPMQLPGTACC